MNDKLPDYSVNFYGQALPQNVSLYDVKCKIDLYIPLVKQYKNC